MRLSRVWLLAAPLAALLAAPGAAQRVGEAAVAPVPGNLVAPIGGSLAAPAPSLSAGPSAAATPSLLATPAAVLSPVIAPVAAPAAAVAAPAASPAAAPMAALKDAGAKIEAGARAGDAAAAPAALDAMFTGDPGSMRAAPEPEMVDAGVAALAARLDRPTPRTAGQGRRMPPGVSIAFQKSAVMGGGMAALFAGLWPMLHAAAPAATFPQYALIALPLALLPLHFALVSGFWAGRYYFYPKLSETGQAAFRTAWTAVAAVYPAAALLSIGAWATFLASTPALLALLSPVALLAVGEVLHHFVYRVTPERAQDKGVPLLDGKTRFGGNVGQQLKRMKRRG